MGTRCFPIATTKVGESVLAQARPNYFEEFSTKGAVGPTGTHHGQSQQAPMDMCLGLTKLCVVSFTATVDAVGTRY